MASLQDIRRRIRSVKSIQQITKAMKMVAAARLRRAQQAAIANKPYAEKMAEIVDNVAANVAGFKHPLLETHVSDKALFLIVAADKGLAGAYSSNVFKEAVRHIPDKEKADLVVIGRKTEEHFRNRGYHIIKDYLGISERPTFEHAKAIAAELTARYESGEYNAVHIVYARFVSSIVNVPERFQLLPFEGITNKAEDEELGRLDKAKSFIQHLKLAALERLPLPKAAADPYADSDEAQEATGAAGKDATEEAPAEMAAEEAPTEMTELTELSEPEPETEETSDSLNLEVYDEPLEEFKEDPYIFEPNADEVLGQLLPQYLVTMIYAAQLQAAASELSSRMTAMSSATDNAQELTRKLDLLYNKVRQANITREITEIVGGAEALK
ncbi:MAG: F0F1 ATP synthase subunit gamma [Schwartzia sp.]|nr:F0F1 ATP synthase subunit gamma [Schwartzia sp. (in: firmicutes)]